MLRKYKIFCFILCMIFSFQLVGTVSVYAYPDVSLNLRYNMAGADDKYYIPESYYVEPVITDINKDGRDEIIFANHAICVVDAQTGDTIWKVNGGSDRNSGYDTANTIGFVGDMVIKDIDGDGWKEIVSAHAKGIVSVLNHDGYMEYGWPKQLRGERGFVYSTARSLDVADLNNDGKCEIMVGASTSCSENVWVYDCYGNILPGWPQLNSNQDALYTYELEHGYSYGIFMDGVAAGDINHDGIKEVIVATDTGYMCAYDMYGKLMPANKKIFKGRTWGKVALWEDEATEHNMNFNEGWGFPAKSTDSRSELYKGELGHAVVRVWDIDGDGYNEILTSPVILDRYNDTAGRPDLYDTSRYMGLFIFNGDRTRYKTWKTAPSDRTTMGPPLVYDSSTLALGVQAEPVVCDLDNNGVNEVLINTYDGMVHAFSVDNPHKEFGNFPFSIPQTFGTYEMPSPVLCHDVNGDGYKEIIFTTQTRDRLKTERHLKKGSVYFLDYRGNKLTSQLLPDCYLTYETQLPTYTNYGLSRPAIGDIDKNGDLELVVNTRYSGVCVYDIDSSYSYSHAKATVAEIMIEGEIYNIPAYNINGYNYFKLRDIAALVNDTERRFNISYISALNEVVINPGEPYQFVGGELSGDIAYDCTATVSKAIVHNGTGITTYTPYIIQGNNYFKLRDVAISAGIGVGWDPVNRIISLDVN